MSFHCYYFGCMACTKWLVSVATCLSLLRTTQCFSIHVMITVTILGVIFLNWLALTHPNEIPFCTHCTKLPYFSANTSFCYRVLGYIDCNRFNFSHFFFFLSDPSPLSSSLCSAIFPLICSRLLFESNYSSLIYNTSLLIQRSGWQTAQNELSY